jgi:H+/Cl- antiporter ClcA
VAVGVFVAVAGRVLGPAGDVELLVDNIHVETHRLGLRHARNMVITSLACVSAGGALGPEAPLVSTNGTVGGVLARRLELSATQVRVLAITGMAAGFSVLFGAPLGGALFALEILHRRGLQYHEALIPAVVGAVTGLAVGSCTLALGLEPIWSFPAVGPLAPTDLLWAAAAGVVGAFGAALFATVSRGLCALTAHLPTMAKPVIGGVALAILGIISPWALTYGERQIDELPAAGLAVGALIGIAALKLLATTVTMATGWKGGFIVPLFFIGAALGLALHQAVPSTNLVVVMTALMVAWCVGATKTPLGSTVVVASMAGMMVLPTALIAAVISLLLAASVEVISSQRDLDNAVV